MQSVPGKNDAWPDDPWVDRSLSIKNNWSGVALGFNFLSGAFTVASVIDAVPNGDFIYVVGEVQAAANGYSGGQAYVAVFNKAGIRVAMKTIRRPVAGVSRLGAYGCQPLPNGNIVLGNTVAATTGHIVISEINKNGDIVRGLYVRSPAYGNLITGIDKTKDPWVFLVTTYWYSFVLDARSMQIDSVSNGISFSTGALYPTGAFDPMTNMLPVTLGSGDRTAFIPSGEHIYQTALSYGSSMTVALNGSATRNSSARIGDMLFYRNISSGSQFVAVRDGYHGGGKSGRASVITSVNFTETSQQGGPLVACKGKLYVMTFNAAAAGICSITEVNPSDIFCGGADGTAGSASGKLRMVCFNVGSLQSTQDLYLGERNGLLLVKSQTATGSGPAFLFDFDTLCSTLSGSYGGVKTTGSTNVFKNMFSPLFSGITMTLGECSLRTVTTNDAAVAQAAYTPAGLSAASIVATPLDPDGSTYYSVNAWTESVKIDVLCSNFAIGGAQ